MSNETKNALEFILIKGKRNKSSKEKNAHFPVVKPRTRKRKSADLKKSKFSRASAAGCKCVIGLTHDPAAWRTVQVFLKSTTFNFPAKPQTMLLN